MANTSSWTYTKGSASHTPPAGHWSEKLSDKGFFGRPRLKMLATWFSGVKPVNFTVNTQGYQRKRSRLSLLLGRSRAGGSTYSDHSHEDRAAIGSYSWRSTSSPSGLKQCPRGKSRPTTPSSLSKGYSADMVERTNGIVIQGIKTRVYDRLMSHDKKWVEELPSVLWAVRTTPTTSNKERPFFLAYGSEAMLPTELRHQSTRVQKYSDENQEEQ
uniref:Retrotransposon protein, putative, Ty3-gypsy subclass n=1 Tax=Oryza sativa subsp. japonica TaxID=39947 RepID=Q2R4W4_ORYSJ|nr:retrotransposon protein, putative, Ty3-gypsy subclass [Oryza sativa Japonica Group]